MRARPLYAATPPPLAAMSQGFSAFSVSPRLKLIHPRPFQASVSVGSSLMAAEKRPPACAYFCCCQEAQPSRVSCSALVVSAAVGRAPLPGARAGGLLALATMAALVATK